MELSTIIADVGVTRILVLVLSTVVLVGALMAAGRLLRGWLKGDFPKEHKPKASR